MNITEALIQQSKSLENNEHLKGRQIQDIAMMIKTKDNHIHTVEPSDEELKCLIHPQVARSKEAPSEVIFKNRQAIGDILCFTSAVRDFKTAYPETRVGVISTAMHIWDHNPHIDHNLKEGNIVEIGPGKATNQSNRSDLHICNAFRLSMEDKLGISISQGPIKPDIWMSKEEMKRKPIIDGDPYWILIPNGAPGWPAKQYHRWQEVVDGLVSKGIRVVQLGVKGQYPLIRGAEDFIGKTQNPVTGIRDLFNIFLHSQGSVGLVSMHMHLSAAFNNPCVVVAGAREPHWFVHYFNHQFISTNGTLPCANMSACWACKLEGCKTLIEPGNIMEGHISDRVPRCVAIISPDEVIRAVLRYYDGGLLRYGERKKSSFANVASQQAVYIPPTVDTSDAELVKSYGMTFGGGAITDRDWLFMKDLIKKQNIKTILEFGTGLSTLLFQTQADKVISYETNKGWIHKIKSFCSDKVEHRIWDGKTINESIPNVDLVFVDGPAGSMNREWSTKYAAESNAKWIIVHDANRPGERKWQEKHLSKDYDLYRKGGHRCHLHKLKSKITIDESKPTARIVSTMRGFGGSERSTIELMKGFLAEGFNVEYCPTGNICGPYLNSIPENAIRINWESITNPCDVFVFYCSDTIWGLDEPQYNIFNDLKAKRSAIVVNYKVGKVGQVEWTKHFDKYLFLNRELENEIIKRIPSANTKVLAPPTDLDSFFKVNIDYDAPLTLIRHSSQRDAKWRTDSNEMIKEIIRIRPDVEFRFMPAYSKCIDDKKIAKFKVNEMAIDDFLSLGNCFWYALPDGYTEGGPRVVMEAMACGLPCIVDNHSGMKDRVTKETGWLCNNIFEQYQIIKSLTPETLKMYGQRARQRAKENFTKDAWIKEILS
jgi:ADP-heptose:LPS heptosyltransferase